MYLVISDKLYNYGMFKLNHHEFISVENQINFFFKIPLQGAFVHYLVKELNQSEKYRSLFLNYMNLFLDNEACLMLVLQPTKKNLMDYISNDKVYDMVREKCELDSAVCWLSTLGGMFSALGDYFVECAETAAKIAVDQFKIALRLGDQHMAARCKLYYSMSLIQRKKYKAARTIIYKEYQKAMKATVMDVKLLRMCKGIWVKLQYENSMQKLKKTTEKLYSRCSRLKELDIPSI